jgi:hypothetical protein
MASHSNGSITVDTRARPAPALIALAALEDVSESGDLEDAPDVRLGVVDHNRMVIGHRVSDRGQSPEGLRQGRGCECTVNAPR